MTSTTFVSRSSKTSQPSAALYARGIVGDEEAREDDTRKFKPLEPHWEATIESATD